MSFSARERRHGTHAVRIGNITVGGDAPVRVQSMTNTATADAKATARQVAQLAAAGSELVRITVDTEEAARAVPEIRERLDAMGIDVPLIGDFHYNGHVLLRDHPECAAALDKYRINPGNVGFRDKQDRNFAMMIETAARLGKAVRIGVNWGSLDQALLTRMMDDNARAAHPRDAREIMHEAIVASALQSAARAQELGLGAERIVISAKVSEVQDLIACYRLLAQRSTYALHLGLTEAGMGDAGVIASTAGLAILLQEGIGDTIRVSLTPGPGEARTREVHVAQEILQSLGIRAFSPGIIACPGCGRTTSTRFQELARDIADFVRERRPEWQAKYPGFEELQIAVMGCIVNGPGESKHADIGISLPGSGETPAAPVYVDGEKVATLRGEDLGQQFREVIEAYVARRWGT